MSDVFISYSRAERRFVEHLRALLEEQHRTVWVDLRDLEPGEIFWPEIEAAIVAASAVVYVLSRCSARSPQCRRELEHALAHGKRIIPVRLEPVAQEHVLDAIAARHYIVNDGLGAAAAAPQIIEVLDRDRAWDRAHTRLEVRAHEWRIRNRDSSVLLRGRPLEEAEQQLVLGGSKDPPPTELQRDYVRVSRQIETRRLRALLVGVSSALAAVALLAVVALGLYFTAEKRRQIALSQKMAAQALDQMPTRPDIGLALALEALRVADTFDARRSLAGGFISHPALKTYLHGHTSDVLTLAFSPSEELLASAGQDRTIRLWRPGTIEWSSDVLDEHEGPVQAVAFSPDGQLLASAGTDRRIILWDTTLRSQEVELRGHEAVINDLAFHPVRPLLASADIRGVLILWDIDAGTPIERREIAGGAVRSIAFDTSGRRLAATGFDGRLSIVELRAGAPRVARHEVAGGPLGSVAFNQDFYSDFVAVASADRDGLIRILDRSSSFRQIRRLTAHRGPVYSVAFSPDGTLLASAGFDRQVIVWDLHRMQRLGPALLGHAGSVQAVAFSVDGRLLASAGSDNSVILWERGAVEPLRYPASVNALALLPGGRLVSGQQDGTIIVWGAASTQTLKVLKPTGAKTPVQALARGPGGKLLAAGDFTGTVTLFDSKDIESIDSFRAHQGPVAALAFDPAGDLLVSSGGGVHGGMVAVWDLASTPPVKRAMLPHEGSVGALAFSPDGRVVATGGLGSQVLIWDAGSFEPIDRLTATSAISSLAFGLDHEVLATGHTNGQVVLWKRSQAKRQAIVLEGHEAAVYAVTFSPDGDVLASGGHDGSVVFWDVKSGRQLARRVLEPSDWINDIVFDVTEHRAAVATSNGHVWFFDTSALLDLTVDTWRERVCGTIGRSLNEQEWEALLDGDPPYRETCG